MARIVINPTTFTNRKDALCVAWNEGLRIWMETNGFEPQSEPTDRQRKFFADTAYADDEVMLRRTILARIATFDTSVKDPTDDQLQETADMIGAVIESGFPKTDDELAKCTRLMKAVQAAIGAPMSPAEEPLEPTSRPLEPQGGAETRGAVGGGKTDKDKKVEVTGEELSGYLKAIGGDPDAAKARGEALAGTNTETDGTATATADATATQAPNVRQVQGKDSQDGVTQDGFIIGAAVPTGIPSGSASGTAVTSAPKETTAPGTTEVASATPGSGVSQEITGIGGRKLTAAEAAWQARREASGASVKTYSQDVVNVGDTASSRIGLTSDMTGVGGRKLTAAEAAWQRKRYGV